MFYKVSVFIDKKNPDTRKWERQEIGLETNNGMVAFTKSVDDATSLAVIEEKHLESKDGCRLVWGNNEDHVTEVYSINIVKIWIDKDGVTRNHWYDQSKCYYFENR